MPLHFLEFLGLDFHHHHDDVLLGGHHDSHHDAVDLHRFGGVHHSQHDGVQIGHRSSSAAFLSTPNTPSTWHGPSRVAAAEDLPSTWLAHSAGKWSAREASAFLDSGLTGTLSSSHDHASASSFLSIQKSLTELVQSTPPLALVPLHALSIVGAVPGHVAIELGEGFLFGFQKGFALALAGKTLGSAAAFGIGRSALSCECLKTKLMGMMERWPLAAKVAKGVERGGGVSVFIIRMAPVPCVVKNYSLALLTEIPFTTYLVASFAGLVPTTAAHVYAGTLAPSAVALVSGHSSFSATQAATLASPVVAGVLMSMVAGYYMHQHVLAEPDDDDLESEAKKVEEIELDKIAKAKRS